MSLYQRLYLDTLVITLSSHLNVLIIDSLAIILIANLLLDVSNLRHEHTKNKRFLYLAAAISNILPALATRDVEKHVNTRIPRDVKETSVRAWETFNELTTSSRYFRRQQ